MKAKELKGKLFELTNSDEEFINELKPLIGNRAIKKDKVNKIIRAISDGVFMPSILVDENTLQVVEGNHRVAAIKECIKRNIPFSLRMEIYNFESPLAIARVINNTGSKWAKNEKLYSFCTEGKESYLRLKALMDRHPLLCKSVHQDGVKSNYNITPTLNCVAMGRTSTTMDCTFSTGSLVITDEQLMYGETIITELEKIQRCVPTSCIFRKESVIAWCRFRQSLSSFEKFLSQFKKKSSDWQEPAQRLADWLNAFFEIASMDCIKITTTIK